ncbi:MAG: hypothetical protein WED07_03025 [Candidatus Freyarchaeum deiterrae]
MTLDELEYGEVVSIINGNLTHAQRLYGEAKINWVERDILIAASGLARRDRGAEDQLLKLSEYVDEKNFKQLKDFVENQNKVTWLIFAKSCRVHRDVPPTEEKKWNLVEYRKKSVIVRDSLVEVVEKKRM